MAWEYFADEEKAITDSLTIEFSRVPGKTFHRKVLSKFRSIYFCKLVLVSYYAFEITGIRQGDCGFVFVVTQPT